MLNSLQVSEKIAECLPVISAAQERSDTFDTLCLAGLIIAAVLIGAGIGYLIGSWHRNRYVKTEKEQLDALFTE